MENDKLWKYPKETRTRLRNSIIQTQQRIKEYSESIQRYKNLLAAEEHNLAFHKNKLEQFRKDGLI
jgi:hypothetical protein